MAGPMIPPEILNRNSLFSLLHKIDFEMAEQVRTQRCPTAEGRCTTPIICESLGAVLLIWMRYLEFVIACAAVVKAAGAVSFRHPSGFGSAGYIGPRCCLSSLPSDRAAIRTAPWNNSKAFSGRGVPPSTAGSIIFKNCFPRASNTDVWPDI
jgi:hypothetical protein